MRPTKNTISGEPNIVSGVGMCLVSDKGEVFYDISAQTLNLVAGQCNEAVVEAVISQVRNLHFLSSRLQTPVLEGAVKKLSKFVGKEFEICSFKLCSGSMANEHALKAAKNFTMKSGVFALRGSYHGQSVEMGRVSDRYSYKRYLEPRNTHFFDAPLCSKCPVGKQVETCRVECLDSFSTTYEGMSADVACFFVEPIMVEAGVIPLPAKYLKRLRDLCSEFDIVLIFDEVQTCGGWLGAFTFTETVSKECKPDALTLGKALGAGFPLSAVVLKEHLDTVEYGEHEFTYGGSLVGLAAFSALSDMISSPDFADRYGMVKDALDKWCNRVGGISSVEEVRLIGLICGVVVKPEFGMSRSAMNGELLKFGVVARTTIDISGKNVIQVKLSPIAALNEIYEGLQRVADALESLRSS